MSLAADKTLVSVSPEATFDLGRALAADLTPGRVVLLHGGLGAGKTLLTKGIMSGLGYDVDEVTSPSFALVNLYRTGRADVYHIDLWRLDPAFDVASAVGLAEILEDDDAIIIVEWADRLGDVTFSRPTLKIRISGNGEEPREIELDRGRG